MSFADCTNMDALGREPMQGDLLTVADPAPTSAILVRVTTTVMKHHKQKLLGEERVYFGYTSHITAHH